MTGKANTRNSRGKLSRKDQNPLTIPGDQQAIDMGVKIEFVKRGESIIILNKKAIETSSRPKSEP